MRILDDIKLDYSDVLLVPKRSTLDSRSKVDLIRTFKFRYAPFSYTGLPILAANMDSTGTMKMADAFNPYNMSVALHKFYIADDLIKFFSRKNKNPRIFYTMGISDDDYRKFEKVHSYAEIDYVCVDVANGYSTKLTAFVKKLRAEYPRLCIMAGNVVTPDMVHDLLLNGADIVKIGIGPGSVCTTRKMTGVGYPQLSAVIECADAAHGIENGLICADGGITCSGDIAKAFGGGADFVMCGGLFAGHDECEGELVGSLRDLKEFIIETEHTVDPLTYNEITIERMTLKGTSDTQYRKFDKIGRLIELSPIPKSFFKDDIRMKFYGMSSHEAMEKHYGGKANYRASEGKAVEVPYKGPVKETIEEILGGLRSACTYIGAKQLKHMSKCATFARVNRQMNSVFGS